MSVVVDYRELGGGVQTYCSSDGGGKSASAIFASVGVGLSYSSRQPGYVCGVNGKPAGDCAPADDYWGLWWSDGSRASWTYSSYGVGSLTVPAGGSVGWAWQQDRNGAGAVPPGVAPPVQASSPTATPSSSAPSPSSSPSTGGSGGSSPTSSPTSGSGGGKGGGTAGGTGGSSSTPSPSSPSSSASSSGSSSPSESASSSPSESPLASESPGDSRSSGGSGKDRQRGEKKGSVDRESPGDSTSSDPSETADPDVESPGDSTSSASSEAAQPADQPGRVPTAVTLGVLAALALAIAGSVVVSRRRRGA